MPDTFDPYHRWLGIPPQEQPAHCYRLLGLTLFEGDADVIASAADQRMNHLRTFQTGKNAALSQRLLNEVATARIRLLNAEKKAAYDQQLRAQLAAAHATPDRAPPVAPPSLPAATRPPAPAPQPADKSAASRKSLLLTALVSGVLVAVGGATWYFSARPAGDKTPEPKPAVAASATPASAPAAPAAPVVAVGTPAPKSDPQPPKPSSGRPPDAKARPPQVPAAARVDPVAAPRPAAPPPAPPPLPPTPPPQPTPPPATVAMLEPPATSPPATVSAARNALPDKSTQERLERELDEAYDVPAARRADDKVQLAAKLLAQGNAARQKPDEKFIFLRRAAELACDGGDAAGMLAALTRIGRDFQVDAPAIQERFLTRFADAPSSPARVQSFLTAVDDVLDEAMRGDRLESAAAISALAVKLAGTSYGRDYRKAVHIRDAQLRKLLDQWPAMQACLARLDQRPDDPALNLQAGRWYCFSRGDWHRGLAYLAKASDAALRKAAAEDVQAPADAPTQAAVGDRWWDLAQAADAEDREALRGRAAFWYKTALPNLDGVKKQLASRRLDEIIPSETTHEPARPAAKIEKPALAGGRLKVGKWVDLLANLNLQRDAAVGTWQRVGNGITNGGTGVYERIMFPVSVEGTYDLEVEFTSSSVSGIFVICQTAGAGFVAAATPQELYARFATEGVPNRSDFLGSIRMLSGARHRLLIGVRRVRTTLGMEAMIDKPPGVTWVPSLPGMPRPCEVVPLPDTRRPAFGVDGGTAILHAARFRLLSGTAVWVGPSTPAAKAAGPRGG